MTGTIEIRGGGAVAVDTDTLCHAAARFQAFESRLDELRRRLSHVQGVLFEHRRYASDAYADAATAFQRLTWSIDEAGLIATALRQAAAVYELVELNALHRAAWLAGDHEVAQRLDARRDALRNAYPEAADSARMAEFERAIMWPSELIKQLTEFGYAAGSHFSPAGGVIGGVAVGGLGILGAAGAGLSGAGLIGRGARLTGDAPPIVLHARSVPTARAPRSLEAAASRIPSGDARIRVERYAMPDGSRQYAVYVAGTHDGSTGGSRAFDAGSNVALASGRQSASYAAVTEALEAAGARPGDRVHALGHSQGATVASWLATGGDYDTRTLVTFGSPVSADVGPGTLSVGIRHTDDLVASLAGGGHAASVGGPGSFIVETVGAPQTALPSLPGAAHPLTAYTETAAAVDASTDPRVGAVRDVFAELATARSVTVTEYSPTRAPAPITAPGPNVARSPA